MKIISSFILIVIILASCEPKKGSIPLTGTWQLISGTLIEKNDTVVTDYMKNKKFIKIINTTHFAFLSHDLSKGKDSAAFFSAGGGTYSLDGDSYTEHLEFCNDRAWEHNDFQFNISIKEDTLIQKGVEKVEATGVNRLNIEKYVRVKN
jgi:hypothetical protein